MLYVCHLLNATASPALGGLTPLQALTGQIPDISHFLHFSFWEPIYYKEDESEPDHRFPSQSIEKRDHWGGFAENKGDQLTWKILTDDTNTIIIRSAVRSATETSPNLRLDPPQGEDQPQDLTSDVFVYGRPNPDGSDNTPPMSIINFDDFLGRTFLLPMDENGERKRATISEHVNELSQQQVSREDQLRFKLKIDGDLLDDLISYNQLMEYLEDKTDTGPLEDGLYRFKCIEDHKGPYTSSDPEYNGSSYNLLIKWETGEQTWEPLSNIISSDQYTFAAYAKEHDLLNTPGWKLLKRHARTARRLVRTLKKSKYRQARASRKYKHGWEVPRDYAHALQLDIHNGNNKWKEAIDLEIEQIKEMLSMKRTRSPMHQKGTKRFKCIKDHKGPYTSSDPEYNGSSYNLLIEWETGEQTWEPLSNIIASDPYTCAVYAKEHDLLNTPGWKLLKRHARTARRLIRTLKKSKYRQAMASRKYKHGWEVPRDYAHALQLDIHNGNNKWKEAIDLEIE